MVAQVVVNPSRWIRAERRAELRSLARRSNQVVLLAALTGAATGLLVAAFDWIVADQAIEWTKTRGPWLAAVLPGIGLIASVLIRRVVGGGVSPSTSDEYLVAFHDPRHRLGLRAFAARMLASIATLGSGGPMGLEGPSIYIGATVGDQTQRRLPRVFRGADRRVLMVAGAAAGVAAIFKAPATGAVFALEVPYHDDLARRMLLPALVASASGYLTFVAVHGTSPLFAIDSGTDFSLRDLVGAVAVGVLAGIGARAFAWSVRQAKSIASGNRLWTVLAAGVAVGGLFGAGRLLTGESVINGPGYEVVSWASHPDHSVWLVLAILGLRCLATSATIAGGGVGGMFVPLVVAGSLTGSAIGGVVNAHDLVLFIVIGVAAFLGAGYRVPLAAVMFVAETTGRPAYIVPGLLAAVAAELVMGASSVTSYQRATTQVEPTAEHAL